MFASHDSIHLGRALWHSVRDAALVAVGAAALACAVNALRPDSIPFVQREAHAIYVPCPETLGHVEQLPAGDIDAESGSLVIDARPKAAFDEWHRPGASNVPFDYLEATPAEDVARIAGSGARRVVVYGDGGDPDCGRELAREIAGRGIRNVFYVPGGVRALRPEVAPDAASGEGRP